MSAFRVIAATAGSHAVVAGPGAGRWPGGRPEDVALKRFPGCGFARLPFAGAACALGISLGGIAIALAAEAPAPRTAGSPPPVIEGAEPFRFDPRLGDLFGKIDPAAAGWESEAFQDIAKERLHELCALLDADEATPDSITPAAVAPFAHPTFRSRGLRPSGLGSVFEDETVTVRRADPPKPGAGAPELDLRGALAGLAEPLAGTTARRHEVKIVSVRLGDDGSSAETGILFHASGRTGSGSRVQLNAEWLARWHRPSGGEPPTLASLDTMAYEEVIPKPAGDGRLLFADATGAILGGDAAFRDQFVQPYDHWRARMDRLVGTDFTSNHGIAVADIDGDGLDDLYASQPGGLPNRLFLHRPDGTVREAGADFDLDYLDFTRTTLFVDFDNDGDQDCVLGLSWKLIFLRNDDGRFIPRFRAVCPGMVYALAAADYDNDGDLDLYASGRYARDSLESERQILGLPVPYHDANNGGRSTLWRNEGTLVFKDVTAEVGLDANNTRFTLACAWDDYDNDGDQDLYVANDFGRNNLYRNDGGRFTDVAAEAGVEDIGAGMSVGWGDGNNDGLPDLYVANMYSSAGHRITEQAAFMEGANPATVAAFRRHARGNSLFVNRGDGTFEDATMAAGVNMGRWAWSSLFTDFNNDGRQDLMVANGFITAEGTGDL